MKSIFNVYSSNVECRYSWIHNGYIEYGNGISGFFRNRFLMLEPSNFYNPTMVRLVYEGNIQNE